MTSRKLSLIVATMAAVILMTAGVASASGPSCSSTRNAAGLRVGKLIGKNIVQQAWAAVSHDPDGYDAFKDAVRGATHHTLAHLPADASEYSQCRAKGMSQGICDELDRIQGQLGGACLLDGQMWGDLSATIYCDLSLVFGGLAATGLLPNPPDGLCGTRFEEGCADEFVSYATTTDLCVPFTIAPHAEAYAQAQANMCIYEVP